MPTSSSLPHQGKTCSPRLAKEPAIQAQVCVPKNGPKLTKIRSHQGLPNVTQQGGSLQLRPSQEQHYTGHSRQGKYNSAYSIGFCCDTYPSQVYGLLYVIMSDMQSLRYDYDLCMCDIKRHAHQFLSRNKIKYEMMKSKQPTGNL
ncbi:hypothetical protein TIFTF001_033350 [Ficus carica]|uniref:Uncharacterized protein n=1 Tax=Ficus carica TaxID=3494 RepID=A0AA88DYR4_FICCA|nr:hypothetical protein TIFTF001_033350 [Ficus carica]